MSGKVNRVVFVYIVELRRPGWDDLMFLPVRFRSLRGYLSLLPDIKRVYKGMESRAVRLDYDPDIPLATTRGWVGHWR